jgi:hypothetical protein
MEHHAQRWRALAILDDGAEALMCLGESAVQVRENYTIPWYELFHEQVRKSVDEIQVQKWSGPDSRGEWVMVSSLPIPPLRQQQVA